MYIRLYSYLALCIVYCAEMNINKGIYYLHSKDLQKVLSI